MARKIQHPHIHREHPAVCEPCHGADAAALFREGDGDLCRDLAAALGHAPAHHAVVGAEDQQAAIGDAHSGVPAQAGELYDHVLENAKAAQGLCQAVPLPPGGSARGFVRRRYLSDDFIDAFHSSQAFTKRSARGVSPPKWRCGKAAYRRFDAKPQSQARPSVFSAKSAAPFSVVSQ